MNDQTIENCNEIILEDSPLMLAEEEKGENLSLDLEEKPKGDPLSIADFLKNLEELKTPEEKIQASIHYMKNALSQEKTPYFKGFWQARSQCSLFFKESISPQIRSDLWKEYRELCQEFKKLKEMLDEQASFAAEQIEIAIQALENDVTHFSDLLKKMPSITFPEQSKFLQHNFKTYNDLQKELNLLNTFASKINSLRKELIKTEMRIRQKNKFFQALSSLGDKIFPKRKELIKTLSDQFLQDVARFISAHFKNDEIQGSLFFVREEIKTLQSTAKILTLNTHSFTVTRNELSTCWDLIKSQEKEKKKEHAEKRTLFKNNLELVLSKIQEFQQQIENKEITLQNLQAKTEEIYAYSHNLELGRDEKNALSEALRSASKPLLDELQMQEQERLNKEKELLVARQNQIESFKERLHTLLKEAYSRDTNTLIQERDALLAELQELPCLKAEKQSLEKALKPIKNIISEKQEKELLSLSANDLNALDQLKAALSERKEERKELKALLEQNKKASSGSSLSFEKALSFHETIQDEKKQLEKIDASIREIEVKIRSLQQKFKS